jgi:CPA2 family monovalent cation:H+ antiporter-2
MVSLSSTAVVLRVLLERAESDSVHGRACVAILLVQDMAVVPLAMLMAMLVGGESATDVAVNAGRVVLLAAGLVIVLYVIVDMLAVRVLKRLTLDQNRELSMLLAVVTGLGSACAAHYVHVSPALGAFVAGMFLGSSPFATQIRSDVSPLRIVLLTLFFGAAGMVADPVWIFHNLPVVLGVSLGLMLGKTAVMWVILQGLGRTAPIAAASGIALSQIGEFAFVLGSIGRAGGVVSDETYRLIVSVAIVTLIVSPVLIPFAPSLGMRLASWLPGARPYAREEGAGEANSPDVVIVGFGPAGQIAANVFVGQPERVLVIDLNKEGVQKARELGFDGHVGDATQFDVLSHIPISSAKAVVITVPHHGTAMRILEHVRSLAPHTHLVVRSRHQRESADLTKAGADTVIGDEEQVGDMLGRHLSEWQRRNSE